MKNNRCRFKELLEGTIIPETSLVEEKVQGLRRLNDYVSEIIPAKLFRYRECSEIHIDAFNCDMIYAASADKLNDPYDCLLRFDKKYIFDSIHDGASKEKIRSLRDLLLKGEPMPEIFENLYGEIRSEEIRQVLLTISDQELDDRTVLFGITRDVFDANIERIFESAVNYFLKQSHVACFSETIKAVNMWAYYAKSHTGFALEYDLRDLQIKCDMCHNKATCIDRVIPFLYPVIYSPKRYDATSFVEYYLGQCVGMSSLMADVLFPTKASLYKSTQWSHEKEWRLYLTKSNAHQLPSITVELKPKAIYYGCKISPINRKILSSIAKEKGIQEFQMYVDIQSFEYTMKYRKV